MARKIKKISLKGYLKRPELTKIIIQQVMERTTPVILKGAAGVGKSVLIELACAELKKKAYAVILFNGLVYPEIVLKAMMEKAGETGIMQLSSLYKAEISFKEKLDAVMRDFIVKQNVLLVFDDFHINQDPEEGKIRNERLSELLTYLAVGLPDNRCAMLFSTRYDLLKGQALEVEPFSWDETVKLVKRQPHLKQWDDKSLKYFYFEMGGFPFAIHCCEAIAEKEFGDDSFQWPELRDRIPRLTERIMHKESETVDFTSILVEKLLTQGATYLPENDGYGERFLEDKMDTEALKQFHLQKAAKLKKQITGDITDIHRFNHLMVAEALDGALETAFHLDNHFCSIGFPQLAFDLVHQLEPYAAKIPEEKRLKLHARLGMFYSLFDKLEEAARQQEAAAELSRNLERLEETALHLGQLGMIHEARGKYEEALQPFMESLEICRKLGNEPMIAQRLEQAGSIKKRLGDYAGANILYCEAMEMNKRLDNKKALATDLEQLARIRDEQGQLEEALLFYQQAIETMEELDDKSGIAALMHQMGNVRFVKGELDIAYNYYEKALAMNQTLTDFKATGFNRGQMGLILQRQGQIREAMQQFQLSLEDFKQAGEKKGMASGYHQLGRIHQAENDLELALEYFQKAIEIREESGDFLGAALTYGQLGLLYMQKEELETALRYSVQAYAIFSKYGSPNLELARRNMIRLQSVMPKESFDNILDEYNVKQR